MHFHYRKVNNAFPLSQQNAIVTEKIAIIFNFVEKRLLPQKINPLVVNRNLILKRRRAVFSTVHSDSAISISRYVGWLRNHWGIVTF